MAVLWELAAGRNFDPFGQAMRGYQAGEEAATKNTRKSVLQQLVSGPDGTIDYSRGSADLARAGDLQGAMQFGQLAAANSKSGLTDKIKEYQLYRQQGGNLPFHEYDAQQAAARRPLTKVQVNTGDNAYDKTINEANAKRFLDFQKQGQTAGSGLTSLDVLERSAQDPNFYSGVGAERFALPLRQAVAAFGGDPKSAASMETFRAVSSKAALDAMGGSLGAGFSNADRDFVLNQVPSLGNTPEGNKELINVNRKILQRNQQVSQLARDYARKNGGRLDAGFDQVLADYAEKNPLFKGQPQQAQPQRGGASIPQVRSVDEVRGMPRGTQFYDPNGVLRTVP